jgi:hypothetical protein
MLYSTARTLRIQRHSLVRWPLKSECLPVPIRPALCRHTGAITSKEWVALAPAFNWLTI